MLTLYFARHGETIWNTQSRMQGRLDTELTERGQSQALSLGKRLSGIPLSQVYVSPAPRARRTASLALSAGAFPAGLPVIVDERLHEMDLGNWEGMSIEEVRAVAADNLQAFFYSPPDFTPAGRGETYGDVTARVGRFLTEMEERALCALSDGCDHQILVISHNITLKALLTLLRRKPLAVLREGPPLQQAALYRAVFMPDRSWQISEPDMAPPEPIRFPADQTRQKEASL